ncbi:MAG: hypothetical protein E7381_00525 [Clostridiales bacterium]|nr:hypothetical protein [Clostridiales bacterium]
MRKSTKRNLVATLALSAIFSFGFARVAMTVSADEAQNVPTLRTEDVFFDGAGVYVGDEESDVDKSGIRFCVVAKKSILESKTVGAFLAFADEMGKDTELTHEDGYASKRNEVLSKTKNNWRVSDKYTAERDEYMYTYIYIYDFTEDAYNRVININPYVLENTTYTYTGTAGRSMAQVALMDGGECASKYVKTYAVNYYNGEEKLDYSTSAKYGSTLTAPTVTETDFLGWYADKDFTTEFDFTQTVKGTVNVYGKFQKQETAMENCADFDLSQTSEYTVTAPKNVIKFTIEGKEIAFKQIGETITVANATIKNLHLLGEKTAIFETESTKYTKKITFATGVITSKEEFEAFKDKSDGYYVLATDIVYTTYKTWSNDVTFVGTFDGRGHTISGLSFGNSTKYDRGFFKELGENGVLKNTAFKNVYLKGGKSTALIVTVNGTVQDCYAQIAQIGQLSTFSERFSGFGATGNGKVEGCFINLEGVKAIDYVAGFKGDRLYFCPSAIDTTYVYGVFGEGDYSLEYGASSYNCLPKYKNWSKEYASEFDGEFWDLSGAFPILKAKKTNA